MIPVTKPFLPPKEEYLKLLEGIWERQWLTNMGPLSKDLERELTKYLQVSDLLFLTNGTIALQMAIKALDLKGEIITTPFSFIATTSSIVWEGCEPVFVDIDSESLNIDVNLIEAAISERTTAILATHVYGNPCDVDAIEEIAEKYNLKVIYDAAHAFGVEVNGRSVFNYGDISICSLHATKLYHSTEGGLIMAKDKELLKKLRYMRNFGISGLDSFAELGINGKNSEFHAAMGLVNLEYIDIIHKKRKLLSERYDMVLKDMPHSKPKWHKASNPNYAYYSIVLESEKMLFDVVDKLAKQDVQTRRYFYPSLANSLPYIKKEYFPVADSISKSVLCLPLYYDLSVEQVEQIGSLIQAI